MDSAFYVVCPDIRSLHNVGSIFRTADALGVSHLYLCGYTGTPPRKEIAKVALGAETAVPWSHHRQAWRVVDGLKRRGVRVLALERAPGSLDLTRYRARFPLALLLGNEVDGLSPALLRRANAVVPLPMPWVKESLNVAGACGGASYLLRRDQVS